LVVALMALILAIGGATPMARIIYHIPILKSFRVPARHLFEFTCAISVLAGLGTAAILNQQVSARQLRRLLILSVVIMVTALFLLYINFNYLAGLATSKGMTPTALPSWLKQTTSIPIIVLLLAGGALMWCQKNLLSLPRKIVLLLVLIFDLASCGWFYAWRYSALGTGNLAPPEIADRYQRSLNVGNQRLLSFDGAFGSLGEVPPNLSRLWGVPSAGGYNPLMVSRIGEIMSMTEMGTVRTVIWRDTRDSGFDLMGVRYVFMSSHQTATDASGVRWFADDDQQWLGLGCDSAGRTAFTISLPAPVKATTFGVVSRLACSTGVTDGTEVAHVRIVATNDQVTTRTLVAGRDTSEWAYDCESVRPAMRHQRATIFHNYPAQMYDAPCTGHFYVSKLHLDGKKEIKWLVLELVKGPDSYILEMLSLSVVKTGTS